MNTKSKSTAAPAAAVPATIAAKPASKKAIKKAQAKSKEASGKLGNVVSLFRRPKGATLADLMKATGWQAHSVRGAIAGAIKKKLNFAVLSEKTGDVRAYRIKG